VNATPDCANDYVIYGLNVGGSSSQPNLVGFNNLYTGTATGTAISAITGNGTTVTVTSTAHGLIAGNNVYISGVTNTSFNGTFTVATATTNQFTFASTVNASSSGGTAAKVNGLCTTGVPAVKWAYNITQNGGAIVTSPSLSFDGTKVAFIESKLSGAAIAAGTGGASETSSNATITTTAAHGFSVGDQVIVSGVAVAGYNGTWTIATVPSTTTFTYVANLSGLANSGGGTASVAKGGATFTVLTLGTTGTNGSFDFANNVYSAATPGTSNDASMVSNNYTSSGNTRSSPYVIFEKDVAFFGDDNGTLYRSSCAFRCTGSPTVTAINTAIAGVKMGSPVVDDYSSKLFVGGSDGKLYTISNPDTCTSPCTITSATVGANTANGALIDAPLIDTSFQTVVMTAGDDSGGNDNLSQFNESLTLLKNFALGNSAFPVANGMYSDEYYNNSVGSGALSGFAYFCGNNNSGQASIFTVTMTGSTQAVAASPTGATESGTTVTITTTAAHGYTAANIGQQVKVAGVGVAGYNGTFTITAVPSATTLQYTAAASGLAGSGGGTVTKPLSAANPPTFSATANQAIAGANKSTCSPFTVFTSGGTERLFFSSPSIPKNSCQGNSQTSTDGCVFSYPITPGTGALGTATQATAHAGSSALIVDNTASSTAQAASIYFANEATAGDTTFASTCRYTSSNTASYCAIKLTQSGLQ
jgi:hypothetical protein